MHRMNPSIRVSLCHQQSSHIAAGLLIRQFNTRRTHHQDQPPGNSQATHQCGFTLVEIALALAVIGLLIGGVLKSQEMITNAKLKRIEKEFTQIAIAMVSYQDRYRQLPGDDIQAATRFSIYYDGIDDPTPLQINGDGNGNLDGDWMAALHSETSNFWKHLRASQIITGDGNDARQPKNTNGGMIGTHDGSLLLSGPVVIFGKLDGTVARLIEIRHDDGSPSSGRAQSDVDEARMNGKAISSAGTSYDDGTNYYLAIRL